MLPLMYVRFNMQSFASTRQHAQDIGTLYPGCVVFLIHCIIISSVSPVGVSSASGSSQTGQEEKMGSEGQYTLSLSLSRVKVQREGR